MQQLISVNNGNSYDGSLTATSFPTIVSAPSNLNGIIIEDTAWIWVLTAVSSSIRCFLGYSSFVFHGAWHDNGAGGVVNATMTRPHSSRVLVPPGVALQLFCTIAGTARVSYLINYRLL